MTLKPNLESILIDINKFINIDNDRQKYTAHIEAVKNRIFKLLQEHEVMKYLLNGHQFVGSFGDNLKVRLPDEYDMSFFIKFPETSLIIVKEDYGLPGNVHLDFTKVLAKIKTEKQHANLLKLLEKWLDEKNYLKVEKFQSFINSRFTNIMLQMENRIVVNGKLATLRYSRQGPAHTIHVNESFSVKYSVDFVPSILLNKEQCIVQNIEGQWEAVPKPSPTYNPNYTSFRSSYFRQEHAIIRNKHNLKNALRMTHFLWKAKQENEAYWRNTLTTIIIDLFKAMEKSLKEEHLPFFWDKRLNLYELYSSRLLREMLGCVEAARETLEKAAQNLTLPLQDRVYRVFLNAEERNTLEPNGACLSPDNNEFSHIYSINTVTICVMIIPLRNLKLLNVLYKTNLNLQQSAVRGLKSLSCQQRKYDGAFITTNITSSSVTKKACLSVNCSQIRRYANFSPKPAEREDDLKKKLDDQRNDNDDNKDMPDHGHGRTLPRLMNFPEIMWPSMLNSIKNWIMVQFIIRPYMDREFNIRDFCLGAKKAMQVVSSKLMNGEFTALNDLVTTEALTELKPVIQKLSVSQRRQLEVKESDIYLTFPYQVGIMFDETNEKVQKRWVEITMVFHVLRGLQEMRDSGEEIPWNMGTLPEYQDKVFVCNYRFIKEFTTGHESDWTINIVNHFKPIDLINELKKE
ncbi:hypothetical protein DOY81_000170 [Sarcophaga bullata]|nr:hypothetical protein DOY81_000170 [Sarcophaga bullata]